MKKPRKSRAKNDRPKGSFPLPNGNYVSTGTPVLTKNGRNIYVRAVHRGEPDVQLLAEAFLELAQLMHDEPSHEQQVAE